MKKMASRLRPVPLFLAVWIVLNEDFGWKQMLLGLVFAVLALIVTNVMLLKSDYASAYRISTATLLRYTVMVIAQIYQSGIKTIPCILSGRAEVAIDEYTSRLEADLPLAMLATAVTLTPGTVTVNLSGNNLQILHFREKQAIGEIQTNGEAQTNGHTQVDDWKPVAIEAILAGKRR